MYHTYAKAILTRTVLDEIPEPRFRFRQCHAMQVDFGASCADPRAVDESAVHHPIRVPACRYRLQDFPEVPRFRPRAGTGLSVLAWA